MAITNFYIERAKDSDSCRILFFITDKGKKYKLPTAKKIQEKHWNPKKQRVKPAYTGSVELNAFLDYFEERLTKIYNEAELQNIIVTNAYLKAKMEEQDDANKKVAIIIQKADEPLREVKKTFFEVFAQFIESMSATRTKGTLKTYNTLLVHLQAFRKKTHYNLSFDTITISFRDKFHSFLITHYRLGNTAIQKDFQILKSFLNYATEYGFNTLQEYHKFKFKRADVTKISLSEEDVSAMQNLDLSNNLRLEKVRDMFLFMCATSLRYSDMQAIKPGNIQTTQLDGQMITYMDLIAQKTRGEIQSPLSPYALKLIDKYKGGYYCFPRISNQRFNSYLKEVAQLAQINEKITIVRFVGTERIETEFSKHELVCCHTARRTFVTQFFEKGGNSTACMVFTGHKDPKELETYRKKTLQHRLKLTRDFAAMAT